MGIPTAWIISPDPDTQRLIGLNLSRRGFRVLAGPPQNGLSLSGIQPHLIILDIDLPDKLGWEAGKTLRQSHELEEVPLILILPVAPAARRLAPLQPVRWVEKPLAIDALLTLVRESLIPLGANAETFEGIGLRTAM